jgi:hypothetical protein
MIDEYNGKPRVRAWPRPRGENRNETNKYWTAWLKAVTWLYRYQPAKFQAQLQNATKGTPWMARDPFISGARGRAWSFTDQTGRTYYPLPARQAVSQSLDAIAQIAGSMLFRAANGWVAIEPPENVGDVLTVTDPLAPPEWSPGAGGGSGFPVWTPDAPPQIPHEQDSEFDTSSTGSPAGWALFDPSGLSAFTVDQGGLAISQPSTAGTKTAGLYKALAAGDFTVWSRVALMGRRASTYRGGILLYEDPTDTAARIYTFGLKSLATGTQITFERQASWSAAPTLLFTGNVSTSGITHCYLRIRRNGSSWCFDYSTDGLSWVTATATSLLFAPDAYGPGFASDAPGTATAARFAFSRFVAADVGETGLMQGDRGSS